MINKYTLNVLNKEWNLYVKHCAIILTFHKGVQILNVHQKHDEIGLLKVLSDVDENEMKF